MPLRANDPVELFGAGSDDWKPGDLERLISTLPPDRTCSEVADSIVKRFETCEPGLRMALSEIADCADRSGTENAYHNPQHSRDVCLIWVNLTLANNRLADIGAARLRLDDHQIILGACGALGHDIGHDGTTNNVVIPDADIGARRGWMAFRLETVAADCVCRILHGHDVGRPDIAMVRAAILATDVIDGYAALKGAIAYSEDRREAKPEGDFAPLAEPKALLIAAILRDADVIPSAGFGAQAFDRNTALLEEEGAFPVHSFGPEDAEKFFMSQLDGRFISPPGKLFQPRLDALCALNRRKLRRQGESGPSSPSETGNGI